MWAIQQVINIGGGYRAGVFTSAAYQRRGKLDIEDVHADAEVGVDLVLLGSLKRTARNRRTADGRRGRKLGIKLGASGGEFDARQRRLVSVLSVVKIAGLRGRTATGSEQRQRAGDGGEYNRSVHGKIVTTPNDLKLSDDSCVARQMPEHLT